MDDGGVYPRVGGETPRWGRQLPELRGLSPRGRGNPYQSPRLICPVGSIPAWAGKPEPRKGVIVWAEVYPRVGGETFSIYAYHDMRQGLSPRGRGNQLLHVRTQLDARSIPAWAGKPESTRPYGGACRVYPRVGGET